MPFGNNAPVGIVCARRHVGGGYQGAIIAMRRWVRPPPSHA